MAKRFRPTTSSGVLTPKIWTEERTLAGIRMLNERFLQLLKLMATEGGERMSSVVAANREPLLALDCAGLIRAAHNCAILFDIRFQDEVWWKTAVRGIALPGDEQESEQLMPREAVRELIRETLAIAAPSARANWRAARLLFGMTALVAGYIGEMTPMDFEIFAGRYAQALRPRWSDQPHFWRCLLEAAAANNPAASKAQYLHSIALSGKEILDHQS